MPLRSFVHAIAVLVCAFPAACLQTRTEFVCEDNAQCSFGDEQGICEPPGLCTFADSTCPTGRRFGRHASAAETRQCTHCGNKRIDPGEECDDGNVDDTDACVRTCKWNICGDSAVRAGVEECDDGNLRNNDECSAKCLRCGAPGSFSWDQNGHCYTRSTEALTWEGADRACVAQDGHLVTYFQEAEATAVTARLNLTPALGPHWLGLRDEAKNGSFAWITGEPLDRNNLTGFSRGNAMSRPMGSCLAQVSNQPWLGYTCNEATSPYICEKPGWLIRTADNHAYRGFFTRLPWDEARAACRTIGAHLITLADAEEHGFVISRLFGTFWLGGMRGPTDLSFKWVAGEPFRYAPWEAGNPNETGQACVVMTEKFWRDRKCDQLYPFICELE